jgi:hypothetical protein
VRHQRRERIVTCVFTREGITYYKHTVVAPGELTQVCLEKQQPQEQEKSLEPEDVES